jgi:hypothetical protein
MGMTTAGVTITSSTNAVGNAATVLVAPYERPRIGGNVKIRVVSDTGASGTAESTNTFRIYLVPQN